MNPDNNYNSIPFRLHGINNELITIYLSENNFETQFSLFHKVYYKIARPMMPLFVRHYFQNRYTKKIKCNENFIFPDLVNYLKQDTFLWNKLSESLYPAPYQCAIVITHDVETQKGYNFIPKVIELEQKYGFKGSWNIVPCKYKLHPEILDFISLSGNETGLHGYNHDGKLYYSEHIFNSRAQKINQLLPKFNATGFRSPQVHRNLKWLQRLNIEYDASCFDYDPYQPFPGGTGSIWPFMAGKLVELPYTVPQDHVLFYTLQKKNIDIWINKTNWLVKNRGTILTLTHPDYLMEKNHLALYEEYLKHLSQIPDAWHVLPNQMAKWVKSRHEASIQK